ncbi:MAG: DUF2474 family protein [Proteobacteria bacterium]|nr:DUF2474 family protein [Pseudomonadota bacterium]
MATTDRPPSKWTRLGWFALIWSASVAAMLAVSAAIRLWLI